MKKFFFPLSILFLATSLFIGQGCSEMQGSPKNNNTETTTFTAPQLLPRTEGLGSMDERMQVAQVYDEQIAKLRQDPMHAEARLTLSSLFMQEARITGEHPYYYPLALEILAPLEAANGLDAEKVFQTFYLKSSVLLSQHEFALALVAGEKAQSVFPYNAGVYGVLIDAHVELGDYEKAVQLSDKMVSMRPDLRSYSRISYLRELHGDPEGAIEAMEMAVKAGMPGYEQTAWCRLTLAELNETYGHLPEAEMQYTLVLQERPEYPFAYAGLASIAAQKGDLEKSMELLDKAIALIPEVGFYEQKSELLAQMGRQEEAEALVPEILNMIQEDLEGGHIMDLELAHVQLSLANNPQAALEAAQKAERSRPENLEVQKMLAMIYQSQGDLDQAAACMTKARKTGWADPELVELEEKIKS